MSTWEQPLADVPISGLDALNTYFRLMGLKVPATEAAAPQEDAELHLGSTDAPERALEPLAEDSIKHSGQEMFNALLQQLNEGGPLELVGADCYREACARLAAEKHDGCWAIAASELEKRQRREVATA